MSSFQLSQARSCEVQIALRCFLRLLLECVQHVNGVVQSCNVDHPIGANGVADSDLTNTGTDRWHWFPVARVATPLDLVQFVAAPRRGSSGKSRNRSSESP